MNKKDIDKYVTESIYALDEPYSDPSTIPSYVVNSQISKYFKVAITGDGGDELLGGYKRLQQIMNQNKYNSYAINLIFKKIDEYDGYEPLNKETLDELFENLLNK